MTAIDSQNLASLESYIAETHLVAMIRQEPADLSKTIEVDFCRSYDDLDYLIFAVLPLSSGDRLSLVRRDNSPVPGTEICARQDQKNVPAVLQQAMAEINLTIDDLTWIHPEYEQQLRNSWINNSD